MQIPLNSYRERSLTHLVSKVTMLIQITSFLILNTVLVFGINVPDDTHNDSVICMDKTLLNSCIRRVGRVNATWTASVERIGAVSIVMMKSVNQRLLNMDVKFLVRKDSQVCLKSH